MHCGCYAYLYIIYACSMHFFSKGIPVVPDNQAYRLCENLYAAASVEH